MTSYDEPLKYNNIFNPTVYNRHALYPHSTSTYSSIQMGNLHSKPPKPPLPKTTFPGDPDYGQIVLQSPQHKNKNNHRPSIPVLVRQKTFLLRPKEKQNQLRVYMDIESANVTIGRIIFNLRPDLKPRTCENFRSLCTANAPDLSYRGCKIHRIIPGFVLQSGDVEYKGRRREGKGGMSIYGRSFADENLHKFSRHSFGAVSMANSGPHTNASQFMIVVDPDGAEWCMFPRFLNPFPLSHHY